MYVFTLKGNNQLIVDSDYDSGRHCGIKVGIQEGDSYSNTRTLDKILTRDQIRELEVLVALKVITYTQEK